MRKLLGVLNGFLFFACIGITLMLIVPGAFQTAVYSVVSGSMEPAMKVGSLIYVKPVDFEEIKRGDVITFTINSRLQVATHRVVEIHDKEQTFQTKGDANKIADPQPVKYENVVGKVVLTVPCLGYLLLLAEDARGKLVIAGLVLFLAVLEGIVSAVSHRDGEEVKTVEI